MKPGLWGYSTTWWQSRSNWTAILGGVFAVIYVIWPEFPVSEGAVATALAIAWAVFMRQGSINDANRVIEEAGK